MNEPRDARVVVFGKLSGAGLLLIGIASLIAAGSFFARSTQAPTPPPSPSVPSWPQQAAPAHDFQLIQLGQMRRDQFLLDKRTGRVWDSVCTGQVSGPDCNGVLIWQEMYVDGVTPSNTAAALNYQYQLQLQSQKHK